MRVLILYTGRDPFFNDDRNELEALEINEKAQKVGAVLP